jgi:peptide deformylase
MAVDPTSLEIVTYPHPALRAPGREIDAVDDTVRAVAERMVELMFEAEGIGLAAPQVGLPWRLFVAHVPENEDRSLADDPATATPEPVVYINPTLADFSRDLRPFEEGCLSLPNITGEVRRPSEATIHATGLDGRPFTARAQGLLARCWQHEHDHLDGVLIIDRMTHLSKAKSRAAIRDLEKRTAPL